MEFWRKMYSDLTLVPLALLSSLFYHAWLWYMVRKQPHRTYLAMNPNGQRAWIAHMLKDNDKKNVLAVQTLRNNIMGATLMATSAVLICCGLLTFASKIYSADDKPYVDAFSLGGANDEIKVDSKCAALLLAFLAVFVCQALSVACLTQVNIFINILPTELCPVREDRVAKLLEKGIFLCTAGTRLFFTSLPLMLWIFGPVLVFVTEIGMVAALYSVDIICDDKRSQVEAEDDRETLPA